MSMNVMVIAHQLFHSLSSLMVMVIGYRVHHIRHHLPTNYGISLQVHLSKIKIKLDAIEVMLKAIKSPAEDILHI